MTLGTLVPRRWGHGLAPRNRGLFGNDEFDRLLDDMTRGFGIEPVSERVFAPRVDIHETEDEVRVVADLPGLDEKDIEVAVEGEVLTLRGKREAETKEADEKGGWSRVERLHGAFERTFRLPFEVDPDAIVASYRQGVLTVTLPKPAEAKPRVRQVPITTA